MNLCPSLLLQRHREMDCLGLDRRASGITKSTEQMQDWGYREELMILETMDFLWNNLNLCCALPQLPLPFFTEQHIPREVYPLNKCSRNRVLCPCHCKFVYEPEWPYFFPEKNKKTQNKDKHFPFWLATHPSARLIIIHRADKLSCMETHDYPILDANNFYFEQNISAAVSDICLFDSLKASVYSTDLFFPSFLSSPICSAVLCIICGIKWDIFP